MTDTDLSTWLLTGDAATAIGCSTRTLERRAPDWHIEKRLRPQPGSPAVAVYNPDDVARIVAERRPAAPPFVLPAIQTDNGTGHSQRLSETSRSLTDIRARVPAGDDPTRQLAAAFRAFLLSPPSPPVSEMALTPAEVAAQYITLAQASAIKGLTETRLRRLIKAVTLPAEKDRGWKIRRRDLEPL